MAAQAIADDRYFLSAIVEHKHSPQVRTSVLTPDNFNSMLGEGPFAITLAPRGVLSADRLLGVVVANPDLFKPRFPPRAAHRWRFYRVKPATQEFEFKEIVGEQSLERRVVQMLGLANRVSTGLPAWALVPDVDSTPDRDNQLCLELTRLLDYSVVVVKALPADSTPGPIASSGSDKDVEAWNREMHIRVRRQMLDQIGSYSSEELAAGAASTTTNASQYAADQRKAEKIFGVRFGQAWHYPKFQFDSQRRPYPEMRAVLAALPDDQGWDRVQWFLEPHEKLKGRTPLQVWKTDRQKVVEAANMERWNDRL